MDHEHLNSIACRIFFFGSFLLLAIAVLEWVVNRLGYTVLQAIPYTPARLLELATVLLMFVLAMLLRQIREEVKKRKI
jgi:preprotein translocase subunit SecY